MASFSAGTTFSDGVANDVTAAKLGALVNNATPTSGLIQDRTTETVTATNDTLLFGDASDSNNLKKITVANFAQTLPTASITTGTIVSATLGTTTGTAATFTAGTIPTLTSTTLLTVGTGTAASPAIIPTGDTNTGIFFPAADRMAFSTGGTEALRVDTSGNIGIGSTSPNSKLTVSGDVQVLSTNYLSFTNTSQQTYIRAPLSSTLAFGTDSTERLRIDSSGRVGIGTTSPSGKLHVSNAFISGETGAQVVFPLNMTIGYGGSDYATIGYNLDYRTATGNTTGVKYLVADTISQLDLSSAGFIFRNAPSGSAGSTATLTERLRIDSSGNVGIGISSPVNKLDVVGSFGRGAPVTKTANFTLGDTENWVIVNNSSANTTVTLPAASSWTGREVTIKNLQATRTVISASSNIVPRGSATAGTAILAASAGSWATLVSDGTNWVIMCGS